MGKRGNGTFYSNWYSQNFPILLRIDGGTLISHETYNLRIRDKSNGKKTMKTVKILARIVGSILLIAALIISGCILLFSLLSNSMCGSEVFQEVYSPNGKYKAVVFERNCGATTGFSTQISIVKANTVLKNQSGNIFRADGYPDWFSINIKWIDDQHIIIEHNGKPIPDIAKNKIGRFKIRYIENITGIMPPRPFMPNELLLPVHYFPQGWTSEERRALGSEIIKGSKENNPYMLYTPPLLAESFEAEHSITRLDNIDQATEYFQQELKALKEDYPDNCVPSGTSSEETVFSAYTENFAIGYAISEHECKMIAEYDEFFIEFQATISENSLTYTQFNDLVKIIDQIMAQHLQK